MARMDRRGFRRLVCRRSAQLSGCGGRDVCRSLGRLAPASCASPHRVRVSARRSNAPRIPLVAFDGRCLRALRRRHRLCEPSRLVEHLFGFRAAWLGLLAYEPRRADRPARRLFLLDPSADASPPPVPLFPSRAPSLAQSLALGGLFLRPKRGRDPGPVRAAGLPHPAAPSDGHPALRAASSFSQCARPFRLRDISARLAAPSRAALDQHHLAPSPPSRAGARQLRPLLFVVGPADGNRDRRTRCRPSSARASRAQRSAPPLDALPFRRRLPQKKRRSEVGTMQTPVTRERGTRQWP